MGLMPVFDILEYWSDITARTGAENMAVDQLLMERVSRHPVLRVYQWSEPSVSFGYFHTLQDAQTAFPATAGRPLTYVRRWTGGGVVDHRIDLTYTLVIPRGCKLSCERGARSYRLIHQILGETLKKLGQDVRLVAADEASHGPVCFNNPVECDLTDSQGEKVAGAGQRRTRDGLLHQGSVVTEIDAGLLGLELATRLAVRMKACSTSERFEEQVTMLAAGRYASEEWLGKT